jgi:hypothetical protein
LRVFDRGVLAAEQRRGGGAQRRAIGPDAGCLQRSILALHHKAAQARQVDRAAAGRGIFAHEFARGQIHHADRLFGRETPAKRPSPWPAPPQGQRLQPLGRNFHLAPGFRSRMA